MEIIGTLAALLAVAVLGLVIVSVAVRGPALSWDFFTKPPSLFGAPAAAFRAQSSGPF